MILIHSKDSAHDLNLKPWPVANVKCMVLCTMTKYEIPQCSAHLG